MQSLAFLFRYRYLWVITFILSIFLGLFVLAVFPRRFASEAKLIVKVGRESVSLDPTATSNQTVMLQKTQEEEINSALEVLSSQAIRDQVVRSIGAENILNGCLPSSGESRKSHFLDSVRVRLSSIVNVAGDKLLEAGIRDKYSLEERAANEIQDLVHISASKKSRVISVFSEAKTPEMAKRTADALVRFFQEAHSEISSTRGSYELFKDELAKADQRLNDAKREMSLFMAENQIVSVESNQSLLAETWKNIIQEITTLEARRRSIVARFSRRHPQYKSVVAQLELARNTVSWLKSNDSELPESQEGLPLELSPVATSILNELEDDAATGPGPDVDDVELAEDSEELASQMTDESDSETLTTKAEFETDPKSETDPESETDQDDLLQESYTDVPPVVAELPNPYMPIARKLQKLIRINNELDTLQRRVTKHEQERTFAFEKFEEARIIREQRVREISNIVLFQPATLNRKPVSPHKPITLASVILACFALASVFACYREMGRPRDVIESGEDVRRKTNVNLLARIPVSRAAVDRVRNEHSLKGLRKEVYGTVQGLLKQELGNRQKLAMLVGVQSCEKGNGASTFATVLASAASKDFGLKTLLVDCDSAERSIAQKFRLNGSAGLKEYLEETSELNDCLNLFTPFSLDVMSSGFPKTQLRLVEPDDGVQQRLNQIKEVYDLVVFDLPAGNAPTVSADRLVEKLDKIILVAEQNKTSYEALMRQSIAFDRAGMEIWGIVLNKCRNEFPWQKC